MSRHCLLFIQLLLVSFSVWSQDLAPDPDFTEKLAASDKIAWLKKAAFAERESYSGYDLTFQRMIWEVDPSERYIKGSVTSYFHPQKAGFSQIEFDLTDALQVDSVIFHGEPVGFNHANNVVSVDFSGELPVDQVDSLVVWYQGIPPTSGFGSFEVGNTDAGNPVLWTLSEPYGAMEWWPCKQSLADKIDSIEVKVICPEGNKVAGNGKLISETTTNGKTTVVWKHRYPIATYLVAMAVTNYADFTDYVDLTGGGKIEILNYAYPEQLDLWQKSTENTGLTMELYNDLIGSYPFADEKYGHAQFGWGGGMEHQTMSFMYNLNFGLVAHEMAHQWFGDCITLASWHDIWLNEGFATYMTGLCYERLLDGQYWDLWKKQQVDKITAVPGGSVYVADTTNVNTIFSSRLSYSKGAYLLHMLRWELGDEDFFNGLRNYFNDPKIKYGFASQQDFVGHMEAAGDTTLTRFFDEWYYGSGYPEFQISHYTDYGDNGKYKVSVTQTTSDGAIDFFTMHLPFRVWKNGQSTDLRLYQTSKEQTFEIGEKPDSIQFDPDRWLITKNTLITHSEEVVEEQFCIFPNPVSRELNYKVRAGEQVLQYAVTDTDGRVIIQHDLPGSHHINTTELPQGIYFLQIKTNRRVYSGSFVKAD